MSHNVGVLFTLWVWIIEPFPTYIKSAIGDFENILIKILKSSLTLSVYRMHFDASAVKTPSENIVKKLEISPMFSTLLYSLIFAYKDFCQDDYKVVCCSFIVNGKEINESIVLKRVENTGKMRNCLLKICCMWERVKK